MTYIYEWPAGTSSSTTGKLYSSIPKISNASTPLVSSKEAGLPYGLFVIGGFLAAGGFIYARFIK
ncbi:MAG: hypothetical protein ACXVHR_06990 [Methanobacterium sp.]